MPAHSSSSSSTRPFAAVAAAPPARSSLAALVGARPVPAALVAPPPRLLRPPIACPFTPPRAAPPRFPLPRPAQLLEEPRRYFLSVGAAAAPPLARLVGGAITLRLNCSSQGKTQHVTLAAGPVQVRVYPRRSPRCSISSRYRHSTLYCASRRRSHILALLTRTGDRQILLGPSGRHHPLATTPEQQLGSEAARPTFRSPVTITGRMNFEATVYRMHGYKIDGYKDVAIKKWTGLVVRHPERGTTLR